MDRSKVEKLDEFVCKSGVPRMALSAKKKQEIVEYEFELINRRKANLINPKRFSDKIVWYKLFYKNKDFEKYVCKVKLKDFIDDVVGHGYTARLYGAWENVDDIDWDALPKSFVLKSNCSSFGNNIIFVEDKNKEDFEKIKEKVRPWLDFRNTAINSFSRAYYYVKPMIMAEELLGVIRKQPVDYKIFCFNGVPAYSYSAFEHFDNGKAKSSKIAFYDMEWNMLPVMYKKSQCIPVEKPKHFEEMKKIASQLSKNIPFVRIDFYDTDDRLLVGEMTFYSGDMANKFTPDAFDFEIGKKFVLPKKSKPYSIIKPKYFKGTKWKY